MKALGVLLIFLLAAVVAGGTGLYYYSHRAIGTEAVELRIIPGTPVKKILAQLEQQGVIDNQLLFYAYLRTQGVSRQLKAGDFVFPPQRTPHQVAHLLINGDFARLKFTIPEGWNLRQIAQELERRGLVQAEEFISLCHDGAWLRSLGLSAGSSIEGYLFPETYEVYPTITAQDLIRKMYSQFQQQWRPEWDAQAQRWGLTQHQVVTLASIVEKETGRPEERPLIASVFHNRLDLGMLLQSDPTVIYGLPNFDGDIRWRDLRNPHPYNTYQHKGLPPGPIASPGHAALLAVLYPQKSDFLYFVSKNDGSHTFSKTLAEHNAKVRQYQKR